MVAQSACAGAGADPHRRPGPFRHRSRGAGTDHPQDVAEALRLYLTRFPGSAALRGVSRGKDGQFDRAQLLAAAGRDVIVRILLARAGCRRAGRQPGSAIVQAGALAERPVRTATTWPWQHRPSPAEPRRDHQARPAGMLVAAGLGIGSLACLRLAAILSVFGSVSLAAGWFRPAA
jgi:hypothetical protein